jgi:hypothetical protein
VCLGLPTDASDEARTRNAFSRATHLGRGLAIPPAKLFEVGTDYTRRFLTRYGASREDGGVGTVVLGLPCQETDPFLDGRNRTLHQQQGFRRPTYEKSVVRCT